MIINAQENMFALVLTFIMELSYPILRKIPELLTSNFKDAFLGLIIFKILRTYLIETMKRKKTAL